MYSMLIGIVPKFHLTTFWLVTDHSAGEHALNSFIAKSDASIHLNNLCDFGTTLRAVLTRDRQLPAWLFKYDVSAAYYRIPMHLLWQITYKTANLVHVL